MSQTRLDTADGLLLTLSASVTSDTSRILGSHRP